MRTTRLSIAAALAALLLAGCGKDAAPGTSGAAGEDGLPKPDAVSGSVTGMPNPGESTPNPGQPVDVPAVEDLETGDAEAPVDGELPAEVDGMQTATPEPPQPESMPMPPPESATPANGGAPAAGQP